MRDVSFKTNTALKEATRLRNEILKAEKQIAILQKAKEEAEREAEIERERVYYAQEEARLAHAESQMIQEQITKSEEKSKILDTQNLFLKSIMSQDLKHVTDLHHSIGQDARTIELFATNLLSMNNTGKTIDPKTIQSVLERISLIARKIITISNFATRANFQADVAEITEDLVAYVREYLLNIYGGVVRDPYQREIEITFNSPSDKKFLTRFIPINISIVLDNLINNSRKHKSKNIMVSVIDQDDQKLSISFRDDGKGVPNKHVPYLFDIGFTTTEGSGLGLYHCQTIMAEMQGTISFNQEYVDGAEFILAFNKH